MVRMAGPVGILRADPAVIVGADGSGVWQSGLRHAVHGVLRAAALLQDNQAFPVIVDGQNDLPGNQVLPDQVQHQQFGHFPDDQFSVRGIVGLGKDLAAAETVGFRLIVFDCFDLCRLPAPGMVDQQLCVDSHILIQQIFMGLTQPGNIAHRMTAQFFQPPG